jgi:CBS domain-containing protein
MAKSKLVKDLMVPLSEYATVTEAATLQEAFLALKESNARLAAGKRQHRAVLVLNAAGELVGKIGMMDVLRGLEPKYRQLVAPQHGSAHMGFTRQFMQSMLDHHHLWDKSMEDLCRKASAQTVREFMYTPDDNEYIEVTATLDEAMHDLVMGSYQSLLVRDGRAVIGVLRLSDIFDEIAQEVQSCPFPSAR